MTVSKSGGGLIDLRYPFFRPLWRRVALTAICTGWGVLELVGGSPFWAALVLGMAAYSGWTFFLSAGRHYYTDTEEDDPEG